MRAGAWAQPCAVDAARHRLPCSSKVEHPDEGDPGSSPGAAIGWRGSHGSREPESVHHGDAPRRTFKFPARGKVDRARD